ncbi:MAG: SBBP repeat-containing protein [Bacilli bacterium]
MAEKQNNKYIKYIRCLPTYVDESNSGDFYTMGIAVDKDDNAYITGYFDVFYPQEPNYPNSNN